MNLILVGGLAGSGKTTLAKELARKTGYAFFDKGTLTQPLVEKLLVALNSPLGIDDRESATYLNEVRPLEYECFLNVIAESISLGISTIATAPFLREFGSGQWTAGMLRRCGGNSGRMVAINCVWVQAREDVMRQRLSLRGASRDRNRLEHWDEYMRTVAAANPVVPCLRLDCSEDFQETVKANQVITHFRLTGSV